MPNSLHGADQITLGVGDGGLATSRFLREEILSRFRAKELAPLEDGARIRIDADSLVITTDTYVVDPEFFPGGDIGKLAVSGTVNDLVACGADPRYGTLGLTLTEGYYWRDLGKILDSVSKTANSSGLQIVSGDTKVLPSGNAPAIMIHVTGVGQAVHPLRDYSLSEAKPGDDILVTGLVAEHGLAVISQREGLGFENMVKSDCAPLQDLILPLLVEYEGIHALRDPTRGGVAGVLLDLAETLSADVEIDIVSLPVSTAVRAGCEMLGLDPLEVINEGKMVLVVDPVQSREIIGKLRSHPLGSDTARIGCVGKYAPHPRVRRIEGGKASLMLRRESAAIPRLC